MRLVRRITDNRPDPGGLYGDWLRTVLEHIEFALSLNLRIKLLVKKALGLQPTEKTPRWVSEAYQLMSLVIATLLLVGAKYLTGWAAAIVVVLALYRPFEMLIFIINWIFVHPLSNEPISVLHSYRRTLAGFYVNTIEIVIYFGAAQLAAGCLCESRTPGGSCAASDSIAIALYSSLRTVVTIGPTQICEDSSCLGCIALVIAQIVVAFFLIGGVIASVVSLAASRQDMSKGVQTLSTDRVIVAERKPQ
jgi:hypothetical protein